VLHCGCSGKVSSHDSVHYRSIRPITAARRELQDRDKQGPAMLYKHATYEACNPNIQNGESDLMVSVKTVGRIVGVLEGIWNSEYDGRDESSVVCAGLDLQLSPTSSMPRLRFGTPPGLRTSSSRGASCKLEPPGGTNRTFCGYRINRSEEGHERFLIGKRRKRHNVQSTIQMQLVQCLSTACTTSTASPM
jgi:hypothetical protein